MVCIVRGGHKESDTTEQLSLSASGRLPGQGHLPAHSLYLHEGLYHPFGHVQAHPFVTPLHRAFCARLIKVQEELLGQINKVPYLLYLPGSLRSALLLKQPGLRTFVYGCVLLRIKSGNISEDTEHRKLPCSHELVTSGDYKNSVCISLTHTHTHKLHTLFSARPLPWPPSLFWSSSSSFPCPSPSMHLFTSSPLPVPGLSEHLCLLSVHSGGMLST